MRLSIEKYGILLKHKEETRKWLDHQMRNPDVLILRNESSALLVTRLVRVFDSKEQFVVYLFVGKIWRLLPLFLEAKKWAQSRGGKELVFDCDTGYDILPLAKRLGAKIMHNSSYALEV